MKPLLEAKLITKTFGGVTALSDVSVTIHPGESVALLGGNGAGKSTLVSILSGLKEADRGEIVVDGERIRFDSPDDARHAGIETVFQNLALCPNLDAAGNLFLGREIAWHLGPFRLLNRREMERRTRETLSALGVRIPDMHATSRSYSGGQRQALAFARAIRANSRLLILDEPTAALGVEERESVVQTVKRLRRERDIAILLVTHNLEEMRQLADRAVILRRGRLVGEVILADAADEEVVGHITGAAA